MKNHICFNMGIINIVFCLLLFSTCKKPADDPVVSSGHVHSIIPLPQQVDLFDGDLAIDKNMVLVNNPQFAEALNVVEGALGLCLNDPVIRKDSPTGKTNIQFIIDSELKTDEYQVEISDKGITVKSNSAAGAYYAAQSLSQLFWNATLGQKAETFSVRLMKIKDKPKYSWRGFHVDVSRHFFSKEYLLKIIDWLAYYKFNKLHLHLTDDQGWRVEIDQFPLLTEIGAWRTFNGLDSSCMELAKTDIDYTIDNRFIKEVNGSAVYGGFYTKQDIREIVAYAASHFIEVVPEIDMPGHMSAAIRAYPYLSCADSAGWGVEFSFPICPCNDQVMDFSFRVWDEIAELFPSDFIHIGCDEVEKGTWETSADCQAFMLQHNMISFAEIQNYFVKKIQEHLEAKGKKVIAWDDVIEGDVDANLTLMYWRDWIQDSPERCASNGNNIILAPATPFYLASVNTDEALENLYNYNPESIYSAAVLDKVQGLQSCVWTEIVPSEPMFEKVVFPRMQALSEVCWSDSRNWFSFRIRMKSHFNYLNFRHIKYRRPAWADQ